MLRRALLAACLLSLWCAPASSAIAYNPKVANGGTGVDSTPLTVFPAVTLAQGSTMVVWIDASDTNDGDPHYLGNMTWGGVALAEIGPVTIGSLGGQSLYCYYLQNATAGTSNVTVDLTDLLLAGSLTSWNATVCEITGAAASSFDVSSTNHGLASTAPTTGLTSAATAQANELLLSCIATPSVAGSFMAGVWDSSFAAGQKRSNGGISFSIEDAYKSVTNGPGKYSSSHSAGAAYDYAGIIIALKEAAASGGSSSSAGAAQRPVGGVGGDNLTGRGRSRVRIR
jgi:hypothetical protein